MKGKVEDIGMKRLCSILLALLLLLGACSGEESKNGLPQENLPIGFSGVITMTRGTGKFATAGELKNVGVFAYFTHGKFNENTAIPNFMYNPLNPQLHSRSATYIKRNGLLIRKITIKSSRPFQCAYHPLTP